MARVAVGQSLEPLTLEPCGEPTGGVVAARHRRPAVLLATGMVAIALAVPVRTQLAMGELRRLDRAFALATDADRAGRQIVDRLAAASFPGDERLIRAAEAGVWHQEIGLLEQIDRRLKASLLVDGNVMALRRHVRRYLRLRIDDLNSGRRDAAATRLEWANVNSMLTSQRRRFAMGEPARPDPAHAKVQLATPTSALAIARRWLDQPTGVRLLAVANGIAELDVDASRLTPLSSVVPLDGQAFPRRGFVVYADGATVTAWSQDWRGPPRVIGHGSEAFAATRPDAVWIVDHGTVTEVDGQGRQLVPPVATTGLISSVAVGDGIAMVTQPGLVIWDPRTGRTTCRIGEQGTAFAGNADVLAWRSHDGGLRLTRASTCGTTAVAAPVTGDDINYSYEDAGSFSPDGRTLASFVTGLGPDFYETSRVVTVDVATGRVTMPTAQGVWALTVPIVWTADSRRLFYTVATLDGASLPATYVPGGPVARVLRYRSPPAFWVMAVIPST